MEREQFIACQRLRTSQKTQRYSTDTLNLANTYRFSVRGFKVF